jgi:AcrR family transcriptional regulator
MKNTKQPVTNKGSSTRDRIVKEARKQLVERGYEAFVMRELADSLGMKLGNLQYYFKTREALILHVIEQEAAKDVLTIQSLRQNGDSADDAFRAIVRNLVTRWRDSGGVLFSTLSTLAMHNKSYKQLYRTIYRDFYLALEGPLREMKPNISDDEIALRVRLITALIDGSPMQTQVGSVQNFLDSVQIQAEVIALA